MSPIKNFAAFLFIILCASFIDGQSSSPTPKRETGFLKREVTSGANTMNYRVYVPMGYDPGKKYPVVLYLHGAGETGKDNEKQIGHGLGGVIQLFMWKYPERFGSFIAVFPQTQNFWFGEAAELAVKALDQTVTEFNGDSQRIYVTGFSLGGYGCFYLAAKYPKKFAAAVPASGGILPPSNIPLAALKTSMPAEMFALYSAQDPYAAFAKSIGKTPIWIFHGGQDEFIDVKESRKMNAALKASGGSVKYTEYAEEKHFISDKVYTDIEFWKWLFAQNSAQ